MLKRTFAVLALALAFGLFGTQCWAATCDDSESEVASCTNTFTPTDTTGTYDFTFTGDGILTVHFNTALTTFNLTVTVDHTIDPLDPNVFPEGTVCVAYDSNGVQCDEYDFTGNKGGPNGVPVKNIDYKGLITLTLRYFSSQTVHTPAFGHAPGDNASAVYDVNFISGYSLKPFSDPTMQGQLPGLSAVAAFDEPAGNDQFCFVSPTSLQQFHVGQEVEVEFQLFASGSCSNNTGTPILDKDAHFSLSTTVSGNVVFPRIQDKEEGNKFHWDHKDGVNEFDFDTEGLAPGRYTITVFGSKFSPPRSIDINLIP